MESIESRSGDKCQHCCDGWLVIYASRPKGERLRLGYLRCGKCKHKPEQNRIIYEPRRVNEKNATSEYISD
jgi:hypothetical protein